jgi:hypothetical protein
MNTFVGTVMCLMTKQIIPFNDSATVTTQSLNTLEMSTRNVFNPAECDWFDNSARKCGQLLSRQSDRNLP